MKLMASLFGFLALVVLLGLTSCHELGHIDGPGDYGGISGNDLVGEGRKVDSRRGTFEVRNRDGRRVLVALPFNTSRADRDRFDRLREGDSVRVEGTYVNQDRFDFEAFL